ncbi:MAG: HIT domain-containing protein [Candidatus Pacearchaeota archaeon]|nr:HIT domain-containing protein [Candidatus Pacearchaeota archaeon]
MQNVRGGNSCKKIYENENFFSIPDINQEIKGHALVISKKHLATILELPNSIVKHFHIHILPRKKMMR